MKHFCTEYKRVSWHFTYVGGKPLLLESKTILIRSVLQGGLKFTCKYIILISLEEAKYTVTDFVTYLRALEHINWSVIHGDQ